MSPARTIRSERYVTYNLKTGELKTLMGEVLVITRHMEIHEICGEISLGDKMELSLEPIDERNDMLEIIISEDNYVYVYGQQNSRMEY